jgi:hypothetical protein
MRKSAGSIREPNAEGQADVGEWSDIEWTALYDASMVKCAECGFLAVRLRQERILAEAEGNYRETGELPVEFPGKQYYVYEEVPLCFERLRQFSLHQCRSTVGRQEVLQQDIGPCVGFTEWRQGFTPKEHREMLDRREMRDWQEKQDAKRTSDRRLDALILVFVAGGFTILGAVLSALLS